MHLALWAALIQIQTIQKKEGGGPPLPIAAATLGATAAARPHHPARSDDRSWHRCAAPVVLGPYSLVAAATVLSSAAGPSARRELHEVALIPCRRPSAHGRPRHVRRLPDPSLLISGVATMRMGVTTSTTASRIASNPIPKRAKWNHQMQLFLIDLLKEHDVPVFRTHNAWSKDAWTNIVNRLNTKFNTSFSLGQVKQKEQDLKKAYRSVKDLVAESGFGWDKERMMLHAPPSVWASFAARKNSKDALHWQDRSVPYYDALAQLYDGRHAEGRTRHGMDHYASKSKNASVPPTQAAHVANTYQSPSPKFNLPGQSSLQFCFDEDFQEANLDISQHSSTPVQHMQVPPNSTQLPSEVPECRRGKKQKTKSTSPDDGFHERYLKLKREEIDRFASIEEKKLEDPYNINKCITVLEGLNGLQMADILEAADIFKNKENREVFLSFSSDALRLAWIIREIGRDHLDLRD